MPDDVRIIKEGSGEDVKYYAQLGADAASKKQLGSHSIKTGSMTVANKSPQTISVSGKIFAVILSETTGVSIIACPYWDGTKLCNNDKTYVHIYATIADDRKSVTFYCTQANAKTINYAIFCE